MLLRLFSRRWLLATALVIAAAAIMARLGIWQLDRLEQRRAFNARAVAQMEESPLTLQEGTLDLDLYSMEYRHVIVTGEYLPQDEIVLRNQVWNTEFGSQLGVQLFTPLLVQGTNTAILVQRGWIPQGDASPEARTIYRQDGVITVEGQLRRAETDLALGFHPDPTLSPGELRLDAWNTLDLNRLADQMDVTLLPVYLQLIPQGEQDHPPYASAPQLDLSEGPHLGYAAQWFSFAVLLLIGYPFYVTRQEKMAAHV